MLLNNSLWYYCYISCVDYILIGQHSTEENAIHLEWNIIQVKYFCFDFVYIFGAPFSSSYELVETERTKCLWWFYVIQRLRCIFYCYILVISAELHMSYIITWHYLQLCKNGITGPSQIWTINFDYFYSYRLRNR